MERHRRYQQGDITLQESEGGVSSQYRQFPPAVTPLRGSDILAGIRGQLAGSGRTGLAERIVSLLEAETAASFTSFGTSLAACLEEVSGERPARETVLVPAFSSPEYRDAVDTVGLDVRRYDVSPETLALDTDSISEELLAESLALVTGSVLGYTSDLESLRVRCEKHDVFLIEAIGYSLGSRYNGRPVGTFGECAVLNFHHGKPLPVEGGMVVSSDPAVTLTDEGRPAASPNITTLAGYAAFSRPRLYSLYRRWIESQYGVTERVVGYTPANQPIEDYRTLPTISNFQATIGSRILERLEAHQRVRARNANIYTRRLGDCPLVTHVTPLEAITRHQHVRFPLLVEEVPLRKQLQRCLDERGVQTSRLYDWPPIDEAAFPGAATLQEQLITLPTHPFVSRTDCESITDAIQSICSAYSRE